MNERIEAWLRAHDAARFQRDMDASARSVRGVGTAAKESNTASDVLRHTSSGLMSVLGMVGRAARVAGIGLGLAGAGAVKLGFGFNQMIDSQRVAFTTLFRSRKEAAKFMKEIRQLALESPVLDPETTGNSARLLMAYGLNAKKVLPAVKALGDMSAATGKSIQEVMPRGAMAIGQIASKGKLQAEELNQLAESVGLSRKRIAKELNMTMDEFNATFTPGNSISAAKALPAVISAMEKQSGGAAKKLSKTTAGRFDRFKEMLKMKLGGMTRPLWNAAGRLMGGIADRLQNFSPKKALRQLGTLRRGFSAGLSGASPSETEGYKGASGVAVKVGSGVRKLGTIIGTVFRKAGPVIATVAKSAFEAGKMLIDAFKPAMPFIKNVLGPLVIGFAKGAIGGLVAIFKIAVPIIKLFATGLGWLGNRLAFLRPLFEKVGEILGFVFGPSLAGKAIGVLAKLGKEASGPVATALRLVFSGLKLVWKGFQPLFKVIAWVGDKFLWFIKGPAEGFIYFITSLLKRWLPALKSGFQAVFGGLGTIVSGAFNGIVDFIRDRINNLIDVINFALKAYNKIPLAPNIGLIGKMTAGDAAGAVVTNPSGDVQRVKDTLFGGNGAKLPGGLPAPKKTKKAKTSSASRSTKSADLPSIDPAWLPGMGDRTIVVPVNIDKREIGRVVAEDTDDRMARR